MKGFKLLGLLALTSALALSGCQRAEAAPLPLDVTLGYVNSNVIDEEGVGLNIGTEVNNVRFGLTTFTTDERLESYGAYAGVPIQIHNTKVSVVPQLRVERYRNIGETVGGAGLGLEYQINPTLRLEGSGIVAKGFDNSDVKGEIYTVGLTKTF